MPVSVPARRPSITALLLKDTGFCVAAQQAAPPALYESLGFVAMSAPKPKGSKNPPRLDAAYNGRHWHIFCATLVICPE